MNAITSRTDLLDRVNAHLREITRPPITMTQYSRAVSIARHHGLATEAEIKAARNSRRDRVAS